MDATNAPNYLMLALQEEDAARNSTSAEARKRHEELAIAYEICCLLGTDSHVSKSLEQIEPDA
jgi:hypothetical protein